MSGTTKSGNGTNGEQAAVVVSFGIPMPCEQMMFTPGNKEESLAANMQRLERHFIEHALELCDQNRAEAANFLGISREGLHKKMKALGWQKKARTKRAGDSK